MNSAKRFFIKALLPAFLLFSLPSCQPDPYGPNLHVFHLEMNENATNKFGHVVFSDTIGAFNSKFKVGDMLHVSFLESDFDVPFCETFGQVNISKPIVINYASKLSLTCNMRNFIQYYGLQNEDGTFNYSSVDFTFTLKEKQGYAEDIKLRNLLYTFNRNDYPNLSDAEFANYREVTTSKLKEQIIYRSASPIDNEYNRAIYVNEEMKKDQITHVINLSDNHDAALEIINKAKSQGRSLYYEQTTNLEISMGVDLSDDQFASEVNDILHFILDNEGKFLICCKAGKDRTGNIVALLGLLVGSSIEEVLNDYAITFYNYYGIKKDDKRYTIVESQLMDSLELMLGVEGVSEENVQEHLLTYLYNRVGLSQSEVEQLKTKLAK